MHDTSSDQVVVAFPAAVTDAGTSAEVFATIRYQKYDVESLDIRLSLLSEDREHRVRVYSDLLHPKWNHLWLYAKPPHSRSAEILGLRGVGSEGGGTEVHTVIPYATTVQIGISKTELSTATRFHVIVQLAPSGILGGVASLTFNGDGSIDRREVVAGRINITLRHGSLHARDWYDTGKDEEFGNRVTKLVQRAILAGEVTVPAGQSLSAFHDDLQEEIADICTILSLCYRVNVRYYEIHYVHAPHDAPPSESYLRRRIASAKRRPQGREELINFRDLRDGGLNQLFVTFTQVACKEELSRAIHFLVSAYGSDSLEAGYFLAFAAVECAIGAAEGKTAYALGSARWERLERRLNTTIRDFLLEEFANEQEREELHDLLVTKLPEVRRISIRRRVIEACRTLDVQTDDLWPATLGFDQGFARAATARNALFHAAKCDQPEEMHGDMIRLAVLTERVVLKLLAWPSERIWRWYDQELRWLNG